MEIKGSNLKSKITSIAVISALLLVCFVSVTGEMMRNSNEYGRMIAVSALYDEPDTQTRYARVTYEDLENFRFASDSLAKLEYDNHHSTDSLTSQQPLSEAELQILRDSKNKAALEAILATDRESRRALAEQQASQYQINEIPEFKTEASTQTTVGNTVVLPQGNAAITEPVLAAAGSGTYIGQFVLTGYCPCAICCGKTNGITACGTLATANHTIAADGRYSFGTKMIINGVVYTVEDRGGAIQGNRIDVFFPTHQDALNFGRQTADVYILD